MRKGLSGRERSFPQYTVDSRCYSMDSVLFDAKILESIDFQPAECHYNPPISAINPGDDLLLRPLRISDYDSGEIIFIFTFLHF